ncbi:hypothetical protein ALI22I_06595 [Saccharothrix sp. ALI-22-I]|uniref:aldehyde dehydrogenase family protein n=1 Tax=Saccharothrix sp. ALI-22-I TaxID=1933778 RepID=UPI00097C1ACE|nr:aldehyde dehydrogenase family protein [Saccharothrix sp. ALI-22-I]ONI91925.1 hypothetical protein ALI22I_06595 [Saccharothrix sp. ALI-22-I]
MTGTAVESVLSVVNPATGELITTLAASTAHEVAESAERAQGVFESGRWSRLTPRERASVLLRLADLMERDAETLARLDSQDAGKPITECLTGDVPGAIESIRWFAEAADKVFGRVAPTGHEHVGLMSREPVGVVAAILPWNYPLAMTAWKVGPALAAGNCLLIKPAEATPRSALHLADLAAEAGLPDGVLTVLPGHGAVAGTALARDPLVGALSFTGSTVVGRRVLMMTMWFIVGIAAVLTYSTGVSWQILLFCAAVLTVVRMVPVHVSLLGSKLSQRERLLVGALGPRGTTSIVFGLLAFNKLPSSSAADNILLITVTCVLGSVLLHGLGAGPLVRRVKTTGAPDTPSLQTGQK